MMSDHGKSLTTMASNPAVKDDSPLEPTIDRASQSRIGDQLRAMYNELMQQPVPDRLMDLLGRLDQGNEEKTR